MRQERGRDQADDCWFVDGENGIKTDGRNVILFVLEWGCRSIQILIQIFIVLCFTV